MTAEQRQTRATSADELCREAYAASGGPVTGVALVAVGGYGRGELAPHSDLDVVLVHEDGLDLGDLGATLWYPLWDSGRRLDHSVRSMSEVLEAATDLRVALGLLDARHLAGDPGLSLRLRTTMLADWRRQARTRLPDLKAMTLKRHDVTGELAHASVPDVKEAEGGLRDAGVLKAIEASWLVDASTPALEAARRMLLDVRDEVQDLAGRPADRIAPEMWGPLAERLGLPDAVAAQRHVRSLGRRIAHLSRLAWRRTDAVMARSTGERGRRTPALERIAPGIALSRGEVVLDAGTRPGDDPTLLLRAAAEAASRDAVLAPTTAARLVREGAELPVPWPVPARDALVRLLASGPALLPVWETLDEVEGIATFLPEWEQIRLLPHASAIHRFTVDRHVVETCAEAGALIRSVRRPDLLLVAALLHDIGKGSLHDHSVAGEPLARKVVARMGFTDLDAEVVASLVRWHLLLADLATTRDPDDPATTAELLTHVPDAASLELLRALTEADARAASPAAWTTWRASLVDRLVSRAGHALGAEITHVDPAGSLPVPDVVRRDRPARGRRHPHRGRGRPRRPARRRRRRSRRAAGAGSRRSRLVAGRRGRRVGRQCVGGPRRLPRRQRGARADPPRRRGHPAAPRPARCGPPRAHHPRRAGAHGRLRARLHARPPGGRRVLRPGGRRGAPDGGAGRGGRPCRTHGPRRLSSEAELGG